MSPKTEVILMLGQPMDMSFRSGDLPHLILDEVV